MVKKTVTTIDNIIEQAELVYNDKTIKVAHTANSDGVDPQIYLLINDTTTIVLHQDDWEQLKETIEEFFQQD